MISSQMNDIQAFLGDEEKDLVAQLRKEALFFLSREEMLKLDKVHVALGRATICR